jgi:arylsulfatase A-like enzyme
MLLKINYRWLVIVLGTVAVVFLMMQYYGFPLGRGPKAVISKPKHIIVIDICSLRADHIGAYGYTRPTTPNIDAFAEEATTFLNFWTQSGWCLPNFATLLTGTRPEENQMTYINSRLSPSVTTLAEIFTKNGFATAGFAGSRYLTSGTYGLERGFQTYRNPYTSADVAMGSASYGRNKAAVKEWVTNNKDKPFFLYLSIDDLHSPYTHSENPKFFDPDYKGILDTVDADLIFDRVHNGETIANVDARITSAVEEFKKDPRNLAHLIARYDAGVLHVDTMMGELIQMLKDQGLWDDSMIIVTSHQGEQLGEHGQLGHINGIYEQIIHAPLFIRYPGIASSGARTSKLAERIDIPATVLDAVGLLEGNAGQYTGTSLLPVLTGTVSAWKKYIFASSKPTWIPTTSEPSIDERAVRNDRYKLIWYKYKNPQYELYDLKNDPGETTNLADRLPKVLAELESQLNSYTESTEK